MTLRPTAGGGLVGAVFGCDSGHGAKPQPEMLLAAAGALGVAPGRCAMVGDAAGDMLVPARPPRVRPPRRRP